MSMASRVACGTSGTEAKIDSHQLHINQPLKSQQKLAENERRNFELVEFISLRVKDTIRKNHQLRV